MQTKHIKEKTFIRRLSGVAGKLASLLSATLVAAVPALAEDEWRAVPLGTEMAIAIPSVAESVPSAPNKMFVMKADGVLIQLDVPPVQRSCTSYIEKTRRETLAAMNDPAQRQLARIDEISKDYLEGKAVLYTEMAYRTPDEARAGSPMRPSVDIIICVSDTRVGHVTLSLRQGPVTDMHRMLAIAMAGSAQLRQ